MTWTQKSPKTTNFIRATNSHCTQQKNVASAFLSIPFPRLVAFQRGCRRLRSPLATSGNIQNEPTSWEIRMNKPLILGNSKKGMVKLVMLFVIFLNGCFSKSGHPKSSFILTIDHNKPTILGLPIGNHHDMDLPLSAFLIYHHSPGDPVYQATWYGWECGLDGQADISLMQP